VKLIKKLAELVSEDRRRIIIKEPYHLPTPLPVQNPSSSELLDPTLP